MVELEVEFNKQRLIVDPEKEDTPGFMRYVAPNKIYFADERSLFCYIGMKFATQVSFWRRLWLLMRSTFRLFNPDNDGHRHQAEN